MNKELFQISNKGAKKSLVALCVNPYSGVLSTICLSLGDVLVVK